MKQVVFVTMLLVSLMVVFGGSSYAGRSEKAGSSAAPELLIPVGGRDMAMGGSTLATTTGADAIYWNPAGLARSSFGSEALFSHMNYIADIGVEYVAVATSFEGFGSIGVSLKSLSFGDFDVTTESNPDGTGEKFSPTYVTVGFTYSRLLTDRISVGLTTNLISERIDRVTASGVSFNVGLQYFSFGGVGGLNIGVAVKNIGPAMQFDGSGLLRQGSTSGANRPETPVKLEAASDELPAIVEFGVGYVYRPQESHALMLTGLFQGNNFSDDEYKLGLEYGFDNTLFLRGGYSISQETVADSYIFGFSAGAGFHHAFSGLAFTLDYAFRDVNFFDANHTISVLLGF